MFKDVRRACATPFRWRRHQPTVEAAAIVSASAHNVVRGYDTPELFKSDTLTRLRVMEDELAAQRARLQKLERRASK